MLTTVELLHEGVLLFAGDCMLDTGALQASYIRQEVLDRSPLLQSLQRSCSVQVLLGDDADAVREYGIEYATGQCRELLERGAPGLHFYTLNKSSATLAVHASLGL